VAALPSIAYIDTWQALHRPAVSALIAVLNDYGVPPAGRAAQPLTPAESEAVAQAGVVALTAAFQAYVVRLFEVTADGLTGDRMVAVRLRETHVVGREGHRRFSSPSPEAVRGLFNALFDVLLPGEDIWFGVTVGTHTWQGATAAPLSERDTQTLVEDHLNLRHKIAHGAPVPTVSPHEVAERLAVFDQIVLALDNSARRLILQHTRRPPW